jgi:hypothetical protein
MQIFSVFFLFFSICSTASAFISPQSCATSTTHSYYEGRVVRLCAEPTSDKEQKQKQSTELDLSQAQGGYTLKQRLREEIDSPFRKVRLAFFTASFGSAMIALYFSALNTAKTMAGGFADAQPLDEVLTSDAINLGAVIACGVLVYRDYKLGQANLDKLARGGKLASLIVEPAAPQEGSKRLEMKSYRRQSRVLIAAGGKEYISSLARSMTSDQLKGTNTFPEKLLEVDMVVVPVLLENLSSNNGKKNQKVVVGDTRGFWTNGIEADPETDRNFDISKADSVISFPTGSNQWSEYLKSEIETAATQGYDVLEKGITLTVKKNVSISSYGIIIISCFLSFILEF